MPLASLVQVSRKLKPLVQGHPKAFQVSEPGRDPRGVSSKPKQQVQARFNSQFQRQSLVSLSKDAVLQSIHTNHRRHAKTFTYLPKTIPSSAEWLRPDVRRTATGLDLDEDALRWGASHNIGGLPDAGGGRMCLLLGNVLQPIESAREIPCSTCPDGEVGESSGPPGAGGEPGATLEAGPTEQQLDADQAGSGEANPAPMNSPAEATFPDGEWEMVGPSPRGDPADASGAGRQLDGLSLTMSEGKKRAAKLSKLHTLGADIICAFNYSTCCLHSRQELLRYLHYARKGLSARGGVFAMDLYGGTSSECALRLKRRFGDFTVSSFSRCLERPVSD